MYLAEIAEGMAAICRGLCRGLGRAASASRLARVERVRTAGVHSLAHQRFFSPAKKDKAGQKLSRGAVTAKAKGKAPLPPDVTLAEAESPPGNGAEKHAQLWTVHALELSVDLGQLC